MTEQETDFIKNIEGISLGPPEAKENTVLLCERIFADHIEGDLVEAGVFAGCHPIIMSFMAKKAGEDRRIHMIDSFQGIPNVLEYEHANDQAVYGLRKGEIKSSGVSVCDVDGVKSYVRQFGGAPELIDYHVGWFQDTLPSIAIGKIALLRIDCDLVESVNLCFQHLYPKIVKGGWFVCDDYFSPTCKVVIDEFIESHGIKNTTVIGPEESIIFWQI